MKILTAIISSIWDTITFMDKEQRALVAHVLTVSQAHPKGFNYRNQTGVWESKVLKITFNKAHKTIHLSDVKYDLGWRANAILARHFAMLHIYLHHEHIGKALSEIDMVTPTDGFATKVVEVTPIDLSKYVGKNCYVELSDGEIGRCYVNYLQAADAVQLFSSITLFNRFGKDLYSDLHVTLIRELEGSFREVIEPAGNFNPIDLTKFVGKTVRATFRNGVVAVGGMVDAKDTKPHVSFRCRQYTKDGVHCHGINNDFDIVAVEEVEQQKPPEWITDIDLTQWIGKTVDVKLRNGMIIDHVLVSAKQNGVVYHVNLGDMPYTKQGGYWHDMSDDRDVIEIKLSN